MDAEFCGIQQKDRLNFTLMMANMNRPMGRKRQANHDLPPRLHKKGKAYYYVTSTKPRQWIPLGSDLPAARVKWAELENGPKDESLLSVLIEEWLVSEHFNSLAAKSRSGYIGIARQVLGFFAGARVADIRPHIIAQWMDAHPSKNRANFGKSLLSNVLTVAVRRGLIDRNPALEIKRHSVPRRTRYITDDEFKQIREHANAVLRAAMDISYITAARISDVLAIKLKDWTPEGLYIHQKKTKKFQLFERNEHLERVIEAAKRIPRPVRGMYLLCTRQGQPYSYGAMHTWWVEAVKKSGVKDVVFHDIRGKSATDAKRSGIDYQALLGHASKTMSDRYIKLEEAQRVESLQRKI
ncbi:MAG: tyrosine-type recombinase/integrase [Candidatus Accumulibacter sp.]|jgi:integrase|nr:tyrosine-type recombinase/integrase [Accumulibacter sp.]